MEACECRLHSRGGEYYDPGPCLCYWQVGDLEGDLSYQDLEEFSKIYQILVCFDRKPIEVQLKNSSCHLSVFHFQISLGHASSHSTPSSIDVDSQHECRCCHSCHLIPCPICWPLEWEPIFSNPSPSSQTLTRRFEREPIVPHQEKPHLLIYSYKLKYVRVCKKSAVISCKYVA